MYIQHTQILKICNNFIYLTYTFFKEYTQFCAFNVHTISKNLHNFVHLWHKFFMNVHDSIHSTYTIFKKCSQFFKKHK